MRTSLALLAGLLLFTAPPAQAQIDSGPLDDLKARAQAFLNALRKEDYASATKNFDETVGKLMPADKLKEMWQGLIEQLGPFKKQDGVRTEKSAKYDVVFITCVFEKTTLDLKLVFDADKRITGLFFVPPKSKVEWQRPAYVKPDAFRDMPVKIGSGEWELPGTLTLPAGEGRFAAVVLVHGSGPNDRDETIGPNKPFRDLAEGLASHGVAVLRYNKRTREHAGKMAGVHDTLTVKEEVIDDALAAVALLRKTERIDPHRVFVLGHSLGGMMAPRLGAADPDVAGLVILAGATRPLQELIVEQIEYIFSLQGTPTDKEKAELAKLKEQAARVVDPKLSAEINSSDLPLGVPAAYWLSLRGPSPAEIAAQLKQPMLILQGERDYQVTMADFQLWQKTLAGHKNVSLKSYPKLNHLFMEGEGKAKPADYEIAGHVSAEVIEDIAAWIKGR